MKRITMTESTKRAVEHALNANLDDLTDEVILEAIRNNPSFAVTFKEAGQIKIKRVLKG